MPDNPENAGTSRLIVNLQLAECYPHPVTRIKLIETHISWVLLTGEYAYKIKKPLNLGFLDFSTLILRQKWCGEELHLNRRFAPQIYLDVVPITGDVTSPRISGNGSAIEYAVKMRQFPQDALASNLLAAGKIVSRHLECFAADLVAFHQSAAATDARSAYGTSQSVLEAALQNFDQLLPLLAGAEDVTAIAALRAWTLHEHGIRKSLMEHRRDTGAVRECHGDLHLGNIVLVHGRLVPFDCIEFNPSLRWNDVISEVAFLIMDLQDRGSSRLAWLFLNAYLEQSGGYDGIPLLTYYLVYRAMVRAKVHALRAVQSGVDHAEHARLMGECRKYVALARHFAHGKPPALIITHGLSGSGKSRIAGEVMQQIGAIRIRSDVERKRLHGLAPLDRNTGDIGGLYGAEATQCLYAHLTSLAQHLLISGQTVIVDAAFLHRWQRDRLRVMARENNVPFLIMAVNAPENVLRTRIRQRNAAASDPSDADIAVLALQLATQEPLASDERAVAVELPSGQLAPGMCCERVISALSALRRTKSI